MKVVYLNRIMRIIGYSHNMIIKTITYIQSHFTDNYRVI